MPAKKPKFRLFSAVLATVCIVLVIDAVAPTAAIGNSQYAVDNYDSRLLYPLRINLRRARDAIPQ